ncbi:MAG: hypothetical protein EAX96_06055 [Candidatus Lokiarchaeota archaeon]|nr:hypothetical protein [Candidatus Lokiarchaeota archaeon]
MNETRELQKEFEVCNYQNKVKILKILKERALSNPSQIKDLTHFLFRQLEKCLPPQSETFNVIYKINGEESKNPDLYKKIGSQIIQIIKILGEKEPELIFKQTLYSIQNLTRIFYLPLIEIMISTWFNILLISDDIEESLEELYNEVKFYEWKDEAHEILYFIFDYINHKAVKEIIMSRITEVEKDLNEFEKLLRFLLASLFEKHGYRWNNIIMKEETKNEIEKMIESKNKLEILEKNKHKLGPFLEFFNYYQYLELIKENWHEIPEFKEIFQNKKFIKKSIFKVKELRNTLKHLRSVDYSELKRGYEGIRVLKKRIFNWYFQKSSKIYNNHYEIPDLWEFSKNYDKDRDLLKISCQTCGVQYELYSKNLFRCRVCEEIECLDCLRKDETCPECADYGGIGAFLYMFYEHVDNGQTALPLPYEPGKEVFIRYRDDEDRIHTELVKVDGKILKLNNKKIETISSIDGLYYLKHLEEIDLSENYISGIDKHEAINLSVFSNLKKVNLNDNEISTLNNFEKLTQLEELYLSNGSIEDLSPLKSLTNLKVLELKENSIKDITPLVDLTNLRILNLSSNYLIEKFTDLSKMQNLEYLEIFLL